FGGDGREAPDDLGPLRGRHPRPGALVEGAPRGRDRRVDVGLGALGHPPDDLLGVGGDDVDRAGACGGGPVAADEQPIVLAHAAVPPDRMLAWATASHAVPAGRKTNETCVSPAVRRDLRTAAGPTAAAA